MFETPANRGAVPHRRGEDPERHCELTEAKSQAHRCRPIHSSQDWGLSFREPPGKGYFALLCFTVWDADSTLKIVVESSPWSLKLDCLFVSFFEQAFERNADGSRGAALENIAVGENVEVVMEEGRFLPGVVEGIVGLKAGEKKTISVTFPDKIRDKRLAGKGAEFDIELLSVASREIPEFNDEFANSVREGLTADELMEEVTKIKKYLSGDTISLSCISIIDVDYYRARPSHRMPFDALIDGSFYPILCFPLGGSSGKLRCRP